MQQKDGIASPAIQQQGLLFNITQSVQMLNDKLRLIVKYKIHPGDIKLFVEEKPVIDTVDENDRHALIMADIVIDDKSGISINEIKKAKRVIYWRADAEEHAVNIIGIAWMPDQTIRSFKGRILPP